MIPKVINYCWFGGAEKPNLLKRCIESWKKFCPDYEIKEWNESNFDVNICEYTRKAVADKNWAFLVDYARLNIIYNNGGIYLDTDVMLKRNLDEFLKYDCFLSSFNIFQINTGAGFGAVKNNGLIYTIMSAYDTFEYPSGTNILRETPIIEKALPNWKRSNFSVAVDNTFIIGCYDYSHYADHLYTGSWLLDDGESVSDRANAVEERLNSTQNKANESKFKKFKSDFKWKLRSEWVANKLFAPPPQRNFT